MATTDVMILPDDKQQSAEVQRFMPIMSMATAMDRRDIIVNAVSKLMKAGHDYGTVPGVTKNVLLLPGAQKLDNLFGLVPRFDIVSQTEDWTGEHHGNEPFFKYIVKCQLWRGDFLMGEAIGSCSSWEVKYRWRKGERKCPKCGNAAIIKGKEQYGGGWLCFAKKGGCGAKFLTGDPAIEGQEVGRKLNDEICDQVNTILKMAEKRAHLSATTNATSASEFFTVDLEPGGTDSSEETGAGSKEAAQAVAADKIRRMEAGESYKDVSGPPPPSWDDEPQAKPDNTEQLLKESVEQAKMTTKLPFSMGAMLLEYSKMKAMMLEHHGEKGKETYYKILGAHGVEHANELRTKQAGAKCYKDLVAAFDALGIAKMTA